MFLEEFEVVTIQLLSPQEVHVYGRAQMNELPLFSKDEVINRIVEQMNNWSDIKFEQDLKELVKRR